MKICVELITETALHLNPSMRSIKQSGGSIMLCEGFSLLFTGVNWEITGHFIIDAHLAGTLSTAKLQQKVIQKSK